MALYHRQNTKEAQDSLKITSQYNTKLVLGNFVAKPWYWLSKLCFVTEMKLPGYKAEQFQCMEDVFSEEFYSFIHKNNIGGSRLDLKLWPMYKYM